MCSVTLGVLLPLSASVSLSLSPHCSGFLGRLQGMACTRRCTGARFRSWIPLTQSSFLRHPTPPPPQGEKDFQEGQGGPQGAWPAGVGAPHRRQPLLSSPGLRQTRWHARGRRSGSAAARPKAAGRHKGEARWVARRPWRRAQRIGQSPGQFVSGPAAYLLHSSPAADKIEVEMKLDAQEDPRSGGGGVPPQAAAPSAAALGAALGQAGGMELGVGREGRTPSQRPLPSSY